MRVLVSIRILFLVCLVLLSACGSDDDVTGTAIDNIGDSNDYLQGDPFAPAVKAMPNFFPAPASADQFIVASAPGLVAGLKVHRSRVVLKLDPAATTEEVNNLLKSVDAVIVGSDFDDVLYVELLNNPSQQDLVNAINAFEASDAIDLAVEDVLVQVNAGGEIADVQEGGECIHDVSGKKWTTPPNPSEWTGTYFGGIDDREWFALLEVPGPGVTGKTQPAGNWWLEFTRMPAVWNFNDALERRALAEPIISLRELSPAIGIVDKGFQQHDDIPLANFEEIPNKCHGNMVAGIIAAVHDRNQGAEPRGIDGMHPYASIADYNVSRIVDEQVLDKAEGLGLDTTPALTSLMNIVSSIKIMLVERPLTRFINLSYGLKVKDCLDAKTCEFDESDVDAKNFLNKTAELAWDAIHNHDVLIVTAAGNNSNLVKEEVFIDDAGKSFVVQGHGATDAKFTGPFHYLALHGFEDGQGSRVRADNVLVVEAVGWQKTGGRRYRDSSVGGQIAAPGSCVTSTGIGNGYATASGTSFAAPVVTGLAAYLSTLDPGLSAIEIKNIILQSAAPMGPVGSIYVNADPCSIEEEDKVSDVLEPDQPPIIDAFAAVMRLDDAVKNLVDADDGTADGVTVTGLDGMIRSPGDGKISMADLRTFRDAVLQSRGVPMAEPTHFKRDNNRDGCVFVEDKCSVPEQIWSRFDFNGDGILDESRVAPLVLHGDPPGLLNPPLRTDLDVLRWAWPGPGDNWDQSCANSYNSETEGWCENDLPALIDSRDIVVDFSAFEPSAGEQIEVGVNLGGYSFQRLFRHGDDPVMVFTIPHDVDCAQPVPTNADCNDYQAYVVATGISIIRSGGVNHFADGASTLFYNQPLGHDEIIVLNPQVTLTLIPFAGKSNETKMTVQATYNFDDPNILFDPDAAARRDRIRITCAFVDCATVLGITRADTDMTYRFIPTQIGDYSAVFDIRNLCESSNPADCPPRSPIPRLSLPFQVVEGIPPEPEPIPEPEPEPEPLPPIDPPPMPPIKEWSITGNFDATGEYICDQAAKTITTISSGTEPRYPTKNDTSDTESVNETTVRNLPDDVSGYCAPPPWWWTLYNSHYSGFWDQHLYAASAAYKMTGEQGSRRLHIKTRVVGYRASCVGEGDGKDNGCYPYTWHSGYRSDGEPYGYYTFAKPNIYPEYPPIPTFE